MLLQEGDGNGWCRYLSRERATGADSFAGWEERLILGEYNTAVTSGGVLPFGVVHILNAQFLCIGLTMIDDGEYFQFHHIFNDFPDPVFSIEVS